MKQLILFSFLFFANGLLFAQKSIDDKISSIENLHNKKVYTDTFHSKGWDVERGNYKDTIYYEFTVDLKDNKLVKATQVNVVYTMNVAYYYHNNRLMAADVDLHIDYPSWKKSRHYFTKKDRYDPSEIVLIDLESGAETEIRKALLADGSSILRSFKIPTLSVY